MIDVKSCSKYSTLIAIYMYEKLQNDGCSHTDLSIALGISKNNLSNIMNRLKETCLFDVETEGRNKYYYLSEEGISFYKSLKEPKNRFYYQRAKHQLKIVENKK